MGVLAVSPSVAADRSSCEKFLSGDEKARIEELSNLNIYLAGFRDGALASCSYADYVTTKLKLKSVPGITVRSCRLDKKANQLMMKTDAQRLAAIELRCRADPADHLVSAMMGAIANEDVDAKP